MIITRPTWARRCWRWPRGASRPWCAAVLTGWTCATSSRRRYRLNSALKAGSSYILSGHWRSVRQIADLTAELTGRRSPLFTVPTGLAYLAAPLMAGLARLNNTQPIYTRLTLDALNSNRQISHARASRDLGYQPRPLKDTVQDTLDWFAQNGYLRGADRSRKARHD